ncbi:MAG: ABC transporter substrate-binding protein [Actinomycetota bacterium]|nr:ABC transporter substrate-binding protein [Actinomycetota bacterium]
MTGTLVVAVAAVLLAAGCSSHRGTTSSSTNPGGTTATTASSASAQTFGTLASPCGPGNASGATDLGVTDSAIHIGYGDDRGFSQEPGLDQEMGDAVTALIKWCNDQGGILGRKIVGDDYDAAITQVNTVMQQACKTDFMMVGQGFALDEAAESTRLGCNLVTVPGFTVGPDVANAPEMYQAVPNPVDYLPASVYYEVAKLFPQAISSFDVLHTTLASATEVSYAKDVQAAAAAGWKQTNCGVTINYYGEPSYTPFAQKFQACGVKIIYNNLGPGPVLFGMLQANFSLGVKPIYVMETNDYTSQMSSWNTNGIGNSIYVRDAFVPLEEADINPAVAKYLSLVKATGGKVSQLGEQAASSFLLWATEAKACGSNLTRQCMVNDLSKVHQWTGGGLHAQTDPGNNIGPSCGMLLKLTGTTFSQAYPATRGQFDCNPEYQFKVPQSAWGTTLNSDRIATKFLSANVIKPQ